MSTLYDYILAVPGALGALIEMRWGRLALAGLTLLIPVLLATYGWRQLLSKVVTGSVKTTLIIYQFNLLFAPIVYFSHGYIVAGYQMLGIPTVPTSFWGWSPWWLLAVLGIFLHDFCDYWSHRALHLKWLWPIHAIHHSDTHVSGLTSYRIHALESLVMLTTYTVLLTWLGMPAEAMAAGAILMQLHNVYVHIGVDWDHGPFKLLIASPRFHRWHHADVPELYDKNLANMVPFFDWIFGTYKIPGPCVGPYGAAGVPADDAIKLIAFPFTQWARMIPQSFSRLRSRMGRREPTDAQVENG